MGNDKEIQGRTLMISNEDGDHIPQELIGLFFEDIN